MKAMLERVTRREQHDQTLQVMILLQRLLDVRTFLYSTDIYRVPIWNMLNARDSVMENKN